MNILITGAFGFLGRRLATRLLETGSLIDSGGNMRPIDRIILSDIETPTLDDLDDPRLEIIRGDLGDASFVDGLVTPAVSSVFHLGSLVSGGAEQNFTLGMNANFFGTWNVLDACRKSGNAPKVVFTSSIAAYGGKLPPVLSDDQRLTPESSYGVQKVIGELLVAEFTRKGYVDGRSVRLPIIAVRPGKANTAASSWASAIIREPLAGNDYICPVGPSDSAFILSPNKAIEGLIVAHDTDANLWGNDRSVMMAGLTCTPRQMVDALERVAGREIASRVKWGDDPFIRTIVNGWPNRFSLEKATRLGFQRDPSVDAIIQDYIEATPENFRAIGIETDDPYRFSPS